MLQLAFVQLVIFSVISTSLLEKMLIGKKVLLGQIKRLSVWRFERKFVGSLAYILRFLLT